ncbi:Signal peptidase subunit 3 [Pleurotus pulmonarius]|nr:hypothetical protein EYR38_006250 [Pleurotus pulmonarius]
MHSIFSRLNNGSSLLSSCLMGLLLAITLSTFVFTAEPQGNLTIGSIRVLEGRNPRRYNQKQEVGVVRFNVTADLTPLFHWNTKQIFLYLQAEYNTTEGVQNDVVIWDRIVRRKEDASINVVAKDKYHLRDVSRTFRGVPHAQYALKYNIMPYVGVLTYGEVARTSEAVAFPKLGEL